MMNKLLLLLLFVFAASPLQAQKLYKIVDEDGNVSFSQYPPAEQEDNVTVENLKVSGGPQTTVSEELDGRYCGKIRLPKPPSKGSSSPSYLRSLDSRRSSWEKELQHLNTSIDRNNQNALRSNRYGSSSHSPNKGYQDSIAKNGDKLRDLRCALSWADGEFEDKQDVIEENKAERSRLAQVKGELQDKLQSICGELPAYDPSDAGNDRERKRWYDCSKTLRREINTVQREINKT